MIEHRLQVDAEEGVEKRRKSTRPASIRLLLAAFSRLGGQLLANVEQKDATTFRRVAHEVHEPARAKRAGS